MLDGGNRKRKWPNVMAKSKTKYVGNRVVHPKILGYLKPEILSKFRVRVPTHPPTRSFSPKGKIHPKPVHFSGWVRVADSGAWDARASLGRRHRPPDLPPNSGTSTRSGARAAPQARHCSMSIGDLIARRNQYGNWRSGFPRSRHLLRGVPR